MGLGSGFGISYFFFTAHAAGLGEAVLCLGLTLGGWDIQAIIFYGFVLGLG